MTVVTGRPRNVTIPMLVVLALIAPSAAHAQDFEVVEATIGSVHEALSTGQLTCHTLVQSYLDRIAAYDKTGPTLNTIQSLNPRALAEADSLDAVQRMGSAIGPLHCVPVLLKDQIETRDMPTTYGSALFKDFVPTRDATVVTRLEAAGAIVLAKTTMGEFASRYLGSAFGIGRNAYDPTRNPSGSSGGTGSGVAASFGLVGIGEDTGGSVRGPAAVSGLVGLRPTLAKQAIALDDSLAEGHMALGHAHGEAGEWSEATREYERAIALDPQSADARYRLGELFFRMGLARESLNHLEAASRLDPLYSQSNAYVSLALAMVGRTDEAIAVAQRALALDPEHISVNTWYAQVLDLAGRPGEAAGQARVVLSLADDPARIGVAAMILGHSGVRDEAQALLRRIEVLPPGVEGRDGCAGDHGADGSAPTGGVRHDHQGL